MSDSLYSITAARAQDAPQVIPLAFSALSEYAYYLADTQDEQKAMQHMEYAFRHSLPNELHHGNFFVVRKGKEGPIVASISGYEGYLASQYNQNICAIYEEFSPGSISNHHEIEETALDCEAEDDEFYIDTIAIHPDYRGLGLIEMMLSHMKEQALSKGFRKLSLIAANYKTKLLKYYENLGFKSTDERFMGAATYHHFVKEIS